MGFNSAFKGLNNKNQGVLGCDVVSCWGQPLKMKVVYSLRLTQQNSIKSHTTLSFTDHNVLDYTSSYT